MRPHTILPENAANQRHIGGDVYACEFGDVNSQAMSLMHKARVALARKEYEDGRIFIDQTHSVLGEYGGSPYFIPTSVDGLRKRLSRLESLLHKSIADPSLDRD